MKKILTHFVVVCALALLMLGSAYSKSGNPICCTQAGPMACCAPGQTMECCVHCQKLCCDAQRK